MQQQSSVFKFTPMIAAVLHSDNTTKLHKRNDKILFVRLNKKRLQAHAMHCECLIK